MNETYNENMYVFEFLKFKKLIISIIMNYYFKNYKKIYYTLIMLKTMINE